MTKQTNLGEELLNELLSGRPGAGVKLTSFIVCQNRRPDGIKEIETHLSSCPECEQKVAKYMNDLQNDKYINHTGWWDSSRKG